MKKINLHEPIFDKEDFKSLKNCFDSGWITAGGSFENKFENRLKKKINAKYISLIINCTSALQIALLQSGVKKSHEVITPTITFISTINAILYNSASPLFMDIDDYFNLDEEKTIEFLKLHTIFKKGKTYNKKTKKIISALIIVHTFGNAAKFEKLFSLCKRRKIMIIEDAAESLGTKYTKGIFKNKFTGTLGLIGCTSFNGNKIITSGGGGAIISNDKYIIQDSKHLINQAKVDSVNFIHDNIGYNMRISNLHSAIGFSQLNKLEKYIKVKKKIHELYSKKLNTINGLKILKTPDYCKSNYWLNILEINPNIYKLNRTQIINKFKKNNINLRSVWYPNHLQKPFKKFNNYRISKALIKVKNSVCLPSGIDVNKKTINKIFQLLNV